MKKNILITIIGGLLMASAAQAQDTYIQFTLKERPYVDQHGRVLQSIEGRQNRPGVDEFSGGGKVNYPDTGGVKIKGWHEKGKDLLLKVEGSAPDLEKLGKVLTKEEAKTIKAATFGIIEKAESGVTP
jgi:hypothetical protein